MSVAVAGEPDGGARTIRSGAEVDYPPFSLVDDEGVDGGFSVELMRAALAAMGYDVTFRTGPWAEVRGWLERGEVDALPLVGRTPEREHLFDFSVPYMTLHGAIVVRRGEQAIRDLSDLQGRRVAVMEGDNAEEFLRRQPLGLEIRTTPTFEAAFRELAGGLHDAVVVQRLVALRLIAETGLTDLVVLDHPVEGFAQDFCFAVREGDRDTLALLNEGLAIIMADGTFRRLHAEWFAAMQLPHDRPIVIGGDRNFPPFEFLDDDGRPAGFNVDLTRAIARELGLNIEIKLGLWSERLESLKTGRIDALQGMFYSPERDLVFDFTQAHTVSHYVAVVRRGEGPPPRSVDEVAKLALVVQQDDILHDFVAANGLEQRTTAVADQEQALRQLAGGRHDCAVVSRITALYLIERNGWSNLVLGEKPLLTAEYCYAVGTGRRALLAQLSEGLKAVEHSGDYRRIQDAWLGVYRPPDSTLLKTLRAAAVIIVPLLLVLGAAFAWSWTLRRQVEERTRELEESLDRFQHVFEAANVGKSITLPTGEIDVNRAFADLLGYTLDELAGKTWRDLTPAEDIEASERAIAPLLSGESDSARYEKRYLRKDGRLVWADVSVSIRRDADGRPLHLLTTIVDIDRKKRVEAELKRREEFQRAMISCSPVALYTIDRDGVVQSWNDSAERIFGFSAEEVVGTPLPTVPRDRLDESEALRRSAWSEDGFLNRELVRRRKDGELITISLSVARLRDDGGRTIGILSAAVDVTEHVAARRRIEHLNQVLRGIRDVNQLIVRERDPDRLISAGCRLLVDSRGYLSALIVRTDDDGRPVSWALEGSTSGSKELVAMLERGELPPCCTKAGPTGEVLVVEDRDLLCGPCPLADDCGQSQSMCGAMVHDGRVFGYLEAALESQLRVDAEELSLFHEMSGDFAYALAGIRTEIERRNLESQLHQAQKIESVGRLAGGVAHDFNNMLNVISGFAEMALARTAPDDPLREDLAEIMNAARRSADITRQLLAFARKQTIKPEVLDLNAAVEGMLKMLSRLIGEDIDLSWRPKTDLWPIHMDPSQLDQILANLCVNARDAIAGVGKITIETANVSLDEDYCRDHAGFPAGEFVLLAVSDDGCGMAPETAANVFDPFFTTKGVGHGTGLGLATVYGIVKQNDGFIYVYSERDQGTTFKIYLRRYSGGSEPTARGRVAAAPNARGESVLVVEDEAPVRRLLVTMLERLGYTVLAAPSPNRALELVAGCSGVVDLLITDVVMPEMTGRELAGRLTAAEPRMRVMYISGYTANVIAHRGILDEGVHFLQKPFTHGELAAKVREALDSGAGSGGADLPPGSGQP